jgi:hypothetical protein
MTTTTIDLTTTENRATPSSLKEMAECFKQWRAKRLGRRIPAELWERAVETARIHGVSRTGRALRLSNADLQHRLTHQTPSRPTHSALPTFVEVTPPPSMQREPGAGNMLEIVQANGSRLTLRIGEAGLRDLLPLVQLFMEARP